MHIHDEVALVRWEHAAHLFDRVGWNARHPGELRIAFERSVARAFAVVDTELVGMARVVGDGVYYASLVDVVVAPAHQRRGVGSALVRHVQASVGKCLMFTLTASPDVQAFYRRLGWLPQATAMLLPQSPEQAMRNCGEPG